MALFRKEGNMLACSLEGENLVLCAWGRNGIRVLSSLMAKPVFSGWALL